MREIKFRAWDWNRILSDPKIWFSEWKYNYSINDELSCSDYIYMQYTWLKDKNWREIYEGDIIQYKPNWNYWEVKFIDWCFKAMRKISDPHKESFIINNYHEVIWNIYENKELID